MSIQFGQHTHIYTFRVHNDLYGLWNFLHTHSQYSLISTGSAIKNKNFWNRSISRTEGSSVTFFPFPSEKVAILLRTDILWPRLNVIFRLHFNIGSRRRPIMGWKKSFETTGSVNKRKSSGWKCSVRILNNIFTDRLKMSITLQGHLSGMIFKN